MLNGYDMRTLEENVVAVAEAAEVVEEVML